MIMRTIAVTLCFMSMAGAAAAEGNIAVSDWSNFCLATRGDAESALHNADLAGWAPLPEGRGRFLDGEGGRRTMMIVDNVQRMCIVSHPTQNNVWGDLEALLGHPPTYREGLWSVWVFDNTNGTLTWLSNDDTARGHDAFDHGRAVMVRGGYDSGLDVVMYEFRP